MAQVVETIVAERMADLLAQRDAHGPADMVELRLDGVKDVDVAGALAGRTRPAIVTCRAAWEGGRFDGSEEERLRLLEQAAALGAEFVDIEWKADEHARRRCQARTRVVVSHHDFSGVPSDLSGRVRAMRQTGAEVVKVAVTPGVLRDCLRLKEAVAGGSCDVAIAMGAAGRFTRLWPAWLASRWTYGGTAAPGQVSARELVECYRVRKTTAATAVYAVCGAPLGHSASPAMHNAAFEALGIDAVYVPLETTDAAELLDVADAIGVQGASVTIPLKRDLLAMGVDTDALPRAIGALNTLKRGAAGWEGRNFDVAGFLAPLQEQAVELRGCRALVLGAGGAARAAVAGLRDAGARVTIVARRTDAAQALAAAFGADTHTWGVATAWDLLVNTTPVGMWPRVDESPADKALLAQANGKIVYDMVYNPLETRLLRDAGAAGARTIGGLEMLVGQARRQFEWWTGHPAPGNVMRQAALAFVRQRS